MYASLKHPFYTVQAHPEQSLLRGVLVTNLDVLIGRAGVEHAIDLTWQVWPAAPRLYVNSRDARSVQHSLTHSLTDINNFVI